MRLWRISNYADLAGTGGLLDSARWHSQGKRIVYLADSPASALLEVLVRFEVPDAEWPTHYQLLAVDVPDELTSTSVEVNSLPFDWCENLSLTRSLGDRWLAEGDASLMRVPSAIVPFTSNWLLNPLHPDARRCTIVSVTRELFDRRLLD